MYLPNVFGYKKHQVYVFTTEPWSSHPEMVIRKGLFLTLLLLLFSFAFDSPYLMFVRGELEPKGNCSYVVTVETTCTKEAGTSDHISLRFGDSSANDIVVHQLNMRHVRWVDPLDPNVLDDVPRKPFLPCSVDEFQVDATCVDTTICYLYLKLTGSDDWRPGFVQVRVLDKPHLNSEYFYFTRYLPRHMWHGYDLCDTEVSPFGIKHKRKIFH